MLTVKDGLNHTVSTLTYSGPDLYSVIDALSRTTYFYTDREKSSVAPFFL